MQTSKGCKLWRLKIIIIKIAINISSQGNIGQCMGYSATGRKNTISASSQPNIGQYMGYSATGMKKKKTCPILLHKLMIVSFGHISGVEHKITRLHGLLFILDES